MKGGDISENILVSGQSATVDTVSATLRHNVTGTTIRELLLNGRNWTRLAMLQRASAAAARAGARAPATG